MLGLLTPPGPTTVTFTDPVPAGDSAVIDVSLLIVNVVAGVPPKKTDVAPVKPVPVMFTDVPPVSDPKVGDKLVIAGAVELEL